jgi:hypothetical protein
VVSGVALSIRVTRYFKLLVIYRNPLREMVQCFCVTRYAIAEQGV